jgi:hypothetical protein
MSGYPNVERVRRGARLEDRDLHRPLAHRVVPAHELVRAAVPHHAVAVLVEVHATRAARSVAVDEHEEGHRLTATS